MRFERKEDYAEAYELVSALPRRAKLAIVTVMESVISKPRHTAKPRNPVGDRFSARGRFALGVVRKLLRPRRLMKAMYVALLLHTYCKDMGDDSNRPESG